MSLIAHLVITMMTTKEFVFLANQSLVVAAHIMMARQIHVVRTPLALSVVMAGSMTLSTISADHHLTQDALGITSMIPTQVDA